LSDPAGPARVKRVAITIDAQTARIHGKKESQSRRPAVGVVVCARISLTPMSISC
jgi:hypothetical protein